MDELYEVVMTRMKTVVRLQRGAHRRLAGNLLRCSHPPDGVAQRSAGWKEQPEERTHCNSTQ